MCHRAGLKPGVNFLDLGSGIGNVVIQTALLSGCNSSGVEKLKSTADIADEVHRVFKQRCQLWAVEPGPSDVFQGDFMQHTDKLQSIIQNADVILANNFVFDPVRKYIPCLLTSFLLISFQSTKVSKACSWISKMVPRLFLFAVFVMGR